MGHTTTSKNIGIDHIAVVNLHNTNKIHDFEI